MIGLGLGFILWFKLGFLVIYSFSVWDYGCELSYK